MSGRWSGVRRRIRLGWSRTHPWLVPVLLFGSFLVLYVSTLTRHYTYDSVAYATQIRNFSETGRLGWLFHPHHLLFNPLGLFAWRLLSGVGTDADPLLSLQYMNAFLGALGLVVVYEMLRRGGFRLWGSHNGVKGVWPPLALASAILLGSSYGYWTCATDGRVNMPNVVAVMTFAGLIWGMVSSPSAVQAAGLALVSVLAVGLHQSAGLLIPAGLLSIALGRGWARKKLNLAALYAVLTVLGIACLYGSVGFLVKGAQSVDDVENWALTYARDGRWWDLDFRDNLGLDAKALSHVFVPTGTLAGRSGPRLPVVVLGGVVAASLLAISALRRRPSGHSRREDSVRARKLVVLGVMAAAYAAFFTVWAPGYFVFWVPVSAALVAGFAMLMAGRGLVAESAAAVLVLALAAAVMRSNLVGAVLPKTRPSANPDLALSQAIAKHAGRDDLVLTSGVQSPASPSYVEVYVPYFNHASLRSLRVDLGKARGNVQAVVRSTRGILRNRLARGNRVTILADYNSLRARSRLAGAFPGADAAPMRVLSGYRLEPIRHEGSVIAYRVLAAGEPGAMARAD